MIDFYQRHIKKNSPPPSPLPPFFIFFHYSPAFKITNVNGLHYRAPGDVVEDRPPPSARTGLSSSITRNVPATLPGELNASSAQITNIVCARSNIDSPILYIFPNLFNELSKHVFVCIRKIEQIPSICQDFAARRGAPVLYKLYSC